MIVRWHSKLLSVSILAWFVLASCTPRTNAQTVFEAIGDAVNKVYENQKECVVRVKAFQSNGEVITFGTGFYIDNKGTILSAGAILGESDHVEIETGGQSLPAKILSKDQRTGIVVLQVFNGVTPYLKFGDSSKLKTASPVIGLGYPLNLPVAPSFGMITGFDTKYLDSFFCTTHLRTSVSISPGQIGGPMLNAQGELVGMIVYAADERKFTYILPTLAIQKILNDIAQYGVARHGFVGVVVEEISSSPNDGVNPQMVVQTASPPSKDLSRRVRIKNLVDKFPAANSGLQPGDVVIQINNRQIYRPTDVIDASFFARVGEKIPVVIERAGKLLTFNFVVGERPSTMPHVFTLPSPSLDSAPQQPPPAVSVSTEAKP